MPSLLALEKGASGIKNLVSLIAKYGIGHEATTMVGFAVTVADVNSCTSTGVWVACRGLKLRPKNLKNCRISQAECAGAGLFLVTTAENGRVRETVNVKSGMQARIRSSSSPLSLPIPRYL